MKDVLFSAVAIVGLSSFVGCGVQQAREAEVAALNEAKRQEGIAQKQAGIANVVANEAKRQAEIAKESTQRAVKAEKEAATLRKQLQEVRKQLEEAGKTSGGSAEDRAASDSIVDVEFDDLAVKFDSKTGGFRLEDVPKKIRKLRSRRVRLHGYMPTPFYITGLKSFMLLDRPLKYPYSAKRLLVAVILRKGTSTSHIREPVVVEGRFSIKSIMDGDKFNSYYVIDDAVVGKANCRRGTVKPAG
jgi:hypothetical protein